MSLRQILCCDFCGATAAENTHLFSGDGAHICAGCVAKFSEEIAGEARAGRPTARNALRDYLDAQGRGSLTRLAVAVGAVAPDVCDWANGHRPVPVRRCVAIEEATGRKVRRRDLRPDDWFHIWPELIGEPGAPEPSIGSGG